MIDRTAVSLRAVLAALGLAAALAGPARSDTYSVAGRSLAVEPPQSYCPIDRNIPAEDHLYAFMQKINDGQNRILLVFVDCMELKRWRRGELMFIERYGQVVTPAEEVVYPWLSRRAFLEELKTFMDQGLPVKLEIGQKRLEDVLPSLSSGESRDLGVLEIDGSALYAGVAQKLVLNGREVVVAGIFAMTLMNHVPLSVNIYRPYQNRDTIEQLMAEQRRFVGQLLTRNQTLQSDVRPKQTESSAPPETPDPSQADPTDPRR